MDTTTETKTFRGRTLEQLLPQVRSELGPDAIVVRRREGLAGGFAGFFQRRFVELEVRPALPAERAASADEPDDPALELRSDRATAEGLSTPGVRALVEQAAPFADALLEAAARDNAMAATGEPVAAGLYGPQPNFEPLEDLDAADGAEPAGTPQLADGAAVVAAAPVDGTAAVDASPADGAAAIAAAGPADGTPAPAAAARLEARLVAAGLSASVAADVVGEAVAHGLPFSAPRQLKRLVRAGLARRMPVLADVGAGARRLAFVGAGGAGKSAAVAGLARAYARANTEVVVVALRSPDGGRDLAAELEPLGVSVIAAAEAEHAQRLLEHRRPLMTLVDTPAAGPGDGADVAALAADLRALGVQEVHLALPATASAGAADELANALAPLGITHVALTHADQTARPGAPLELAMTARKPVSYVCARETVEPAEPAALALRLLPDGPLPRPAAPAGEAAPSAGLAPEAPPAAATAEARLVAAGMSRAVAGDVVGEAVAHGLPFSGPRQLKRLVRGGLARRISVLSDVGPGARRLAFVGAGGAGKSAAIARVARAYAAADVEVVVVALRSPDGGRDLAAGLEPLGVSVIATSDSEHALRRLSRRQPVVTLVDTPAAGPGDGADVAALAEDLRALGVQEVHLALPATLSAAAADELASTLGPLGITHLALTHADQTARPGAPLELAMTARKPVSYVCGREAVEPADAAALANRLLP